MLSYASIHLVLRLIRSNSGNITPTHLNKVLNLLKRISNFHIFVANLSWLYLPVSIIRYRFLIEFLFGHIPVMIVQNYYVFQKSTSVVLLRVWMVCAVMSSMPTRAHVNLDGLAQTVTSVSKKRRFYFLSVFISFFPVFFEFVLH